VPPERCRRRVPRAGCVEPNGDRQAATEDDARCDRANHEGRHAALGRRIKLVERDASSRSQQSDNHGDRDEDADAKPVQGFAVCRDAQREGGHPEDDCDRLRGREGAQGRSQECKADEASGGVHCLRGIVRSCDENEQAKQSSEAVEQPLLEARLVTEEQQMARVPRAVDVERAFRFASVLRARLELARGLGLTTSPPQRLSLPVKPVRGEEVRRQRPRPFRVCGQESIHAHSQRIKRCGPRHPLVALRSR
jgi:hypothetical protein